MVDVIGRAKVVVTSTVDTASVAKSGGSIGDQLKKAALVGGAALGTLAAVGTKTYLAFEEAEANSRKLTQVLDNMGKSGAAPAVEKLADELSRLSGVDDDVIKQGQTLLATFSQVAESAGETGGVFDRATRAAVDLAATGFGDVAAASKALGKALQDPEKGVTALSKAGVTFTESQKEQIKNFAEANDLASAQAIVLKEVEKQVKGTAEANATESAKISAAWGEVEETVGGLVADMITAISGKKGKGGLSGSIRDVNDELDEFSKSASWKRLQRQLSETSDLIGKIAGPAEKVFGWWDRLQKKSPELADSIRLVVSPLRLVADALDAIGDAYDAARDFFDGNLPGDSGTIIDDDGSGSDFGSGGGFIRGITSAGAGGVASVSNALAAPSVTHYNFYGPESLSQARRDEDWSRTYGTRFGSAASAAGR